MFIDLKQAACLMWKKIEQSYELTDEYFCNLVTVQATIQEYYKSSYVPLNDDRVAVVYLFVANLKQTSMNQLQYENTVIQEKTRENKEEKEEDWQFAKKIRISMDEIEKYLPGLDSYKTPDEK
jgi:hypothetical protein